MTILKLTQWERDIGWYLSVTVWRLREGYVDLGMIRSDLSTYVRGPPGESKA